MRYPIYTLLLLVFFTTQAWSTEIAPPPELSAKAYLLKDFNSNTNIAVSKIDERVEPASLTKLMTAYLSFKALKNGHLQLNQVVPVSEYAWKGGGGGCGGSQGSCMFINPKSIVTVDELLHGMIVVSGNDASVTLAESIAGSESRFADMMNKEAARLGMKNSHFMNATGLPDPNHYTTVNDLAILAQAIIRDFPDEYKQLYSLKEYTYDKITQPNRNRLLFIDPSVDGMKTGHTAAAGYCLIASARRGNMRLLSVLVGAPSDTLRATESQKLLNYGFQYYESNLVYKQGQAVKTLSVFKGQEKTLSAGVSDDVYLVLPKGDYARIKASVTTKNPLIAPIQAGQVIGKISFKLDDKVVSEQNLIATKAVAEAGFFGKIADSVRLLLQ